MAKETVPPEPGTVHYDLSLLTDDDIYLFNEGSHFRLYEKLGSHLCTREGVEGTYFAVWAPDAEEVFVIGNSNAVRIGEVFHRFPVALLMAEAISM